MICRSNLNDIKEKYKTKKLTSKDNHQEQNIGLILIMSGQKKILWHVNQISIKLYEDKFRGDTTQDYQKFGVTISNARMNKNVQFCTKAPLIKYHQNISNSCCLSSLASAFHCIGENRAVTSPVSRI